MRVIGPTYFMIIFYGRTNNWCNPAQSFLKYIASQFVIYLACLVALNSSASTIVGWGNNNFGQANAPAGLTNVVAIAGGYTEHTVALLSTGAVLAWGRYSDGETNVPSGLNGVSAVAAGDFYCLALRSNGTVIAWGYNGSGALNVPASLTDAKAIAAGSDYAFALRSNGTLVAWGALASTVPGGLSSIKAIAPGIALHDDGTVVSWSQGSPGNISGVAAITAGSFALLSNSTVVAWGPSLTGFPTGLTNVVAIAAGGSSFGGSQNLALRKDGTVVAWGPNSYGQTNVPAGLTNVFAISTGGDFTLALATTPLPAPPNDNFANRTSFGNTTPLVTNSFFGSTFGATSEIGDPNPSGAINLPSHSVWWSWTAPTYNPEVLLGMASVDTIGSTSTNLSLAIFTGSTLSGLSLVTSSSTYPAASVNFTPFAGNTYQIMVDSTASVGAGNNIQLNFVLTTGPGGGVADLDASAMGFGTFNPLQSATVIGPAGMYGGDFRTYGVMAKYANGQTTNIYSTVWHAVAPSTITNGVFTAQSVTTNTPVSISADYFYSGLAYTTATNVIVSNLPPPKVSAVSLNTAKKNFVFTLSGVAGRTNIITAATNLTAPVVWRPVATNVFGASGLLNFTNPTTNFPRQFYRAGQY